MRIVVLVGLPGSGKSTYLAQVAPSGGGLSSDAVRRLLADDETDQSIHVQVFQTLRYLLEQRLAIGRAVTYIDATNLTPEERSPYLEIGRKWNCEVEAVLLDVPLEVCLERNAGRVRKVPVEALVKMAGKLVPPSVEEGFIRILVIPGGQDRYR
jgi:predicted kinase